MRKLQLTENVIIFWTFFNYGGIRTWATDGGRGKATADGNCARLVYTPNLKARYKQDETPFYKLVSDSLSTRHAASTSCGWNRRSTWTEHACQYARHRHPTNGCFRDWGLDVIRNLYGESLCVTKFLRLSQNWGCIQEGKFKTLHSEEAGHDSRAV